MALFGDLEKMVRTQLPSIVLWTKGTLTNNMLQSIAG